MTNLPSWAKRMTKAELVKAWQECGEECDRLDRQLKALTQACRFLLWEYDNARHYDDHFYARELSDQIAGIRLAMPKEART